MGILQWQHKNLPIHNRGSKKSGITIIHRNPGSQEDTVTIPVPAKRQLLPPGGTGTTPKQKPVPARRKSLINEQSALESADYDEPMSHSTAVNRNHEFEDYDIPAIRHARASSVKNQFNRK